MRCPHPDWVSNRLSVRGPADRVRAFRAAARGCGAVPWVVDCDQVEEHALALLLRAPPERRGIGLEGAKALAREFRDFVRDGTEAVHAAAGVSRACPFDLHSLVPVPWRVLRLGPDHPEALAWLWENWGTTWTPRQAQELPVAPAERAAGTDDLARYAFWTADWAPWRALLRIRADWPDLRVAMTSTPAWPDAGARERPRRAADGGAATAEGARRARTAAPPKARPERRA